MHGCYMIEVGVGAMAMTMTMAMTMMLVEAMMAMPNARPSSESKASDPTRTYSAAARTHTYGAFEENR